MRRLTSVLALAGALAACGGREDDERAAGPPSTATPSPTATATLDPETTPTPLPEATDTPDIDVDVPEPEPTSRGPRSLTEETPDYLFEYSYPAAVGRIGPLANLIDRRLERELRDLARDSATARREARADGFPYNKHSYAAEWKVVADLPNWLSLSADIAGYSGGAHGTYGMESLVWNKQGNRAMDPIDFFVSPAALEEALGSRFCDALDRERARRRGAPVPEESQDSFDQCPDIGELELMVGSTNRRTFNRLTLYAGPYVAGPYVEGAYAIELPIDRAVRQVVKAEYAESFAARN